MTQLPTISELTSYAGAPDSVPHGWLPLTDMVAPLDMVVTRMREDAGHCHALYRIGGPQPHALILNRRRSQLGEASFFFTDRNAAWAWAEQLGPDDDETVSDIYQSSVWYTPKGHAPAVEVSVHEYDCETTPETWSMLQCTSLLVTAHPKANA